MDIRSLININRYLDKSGKSSSSNRVADPRAGKTDPSKKPDASSASSRDNLAISESKATGELDFAKGVYRKQQKESLQQLKIIKEKIASGEYDKAAVHENLSGKLMGDIYTLESEEARSSAAEASSNAPEELSPEMREKLLNNNEVLSQISTRILDDLSRL